MQAKITHTQYLHGAGVQIPAFGGQTAKKWRQRVALSSTKPPSGQIRTLSFPLDLNLDCGLFDQANKEYNIIEGVGEGSLLHYLLCFHLAGLSLYPNADEAKSDRNPSQFQEPAFAEAVAAHLGPDVASKADVITVFNSLKSVPRGKNAEAYTTDAVANKLHKACYKKSIDQDNIDPSLNTFLTVIGNAATDVAPDGWRQLSERAAEALTAACVELNKINALFPVVRVRISAKGTDSGMPIAYTGVVGDVLPDEPAAYWPHHVIAELCRHNREINPKDIQTKLCSHLRNALSNLFGTSLWSTNGKDGEIRCATTDKLCAVFMIPDERRGAVARLLKAARDLDKPALFNFPHYAKNRATFGGKLDSWVSNYINRLNTLHDQLPKAEGPTPPNEMHPDMQEILNGLNISQGEIYQSIETRQGLIKQAAAYLAVLRGESQAHRPIHAAQMLEGSIADILNIEGALKQVFNQLTQRLEDGRLNDDVSKEWRTLLEGCDTEIYALPHITGGNPPVADSLKQINHEMTVLMSAHEGLCDWITQRAGGFAAAFESLKASEINHAKNRKCQDIDFADMAMRKVLHNMVNTSRRLTDKTAAVLHSWITDIVATPGNKAARKALNRMLHNNQGTLYRSVWSTSRHLPLYVARERMDEARHTDWIAKLRALGNEIKQQLNVDPTPDALQDYLEVSRFAADLSLHTIGTSVKSSDVLKIIQPVVDSGFTPHHRLAVALRRDTLSQPELSTLLSWVGAQLSRMRFFTRRNTFIVRQKFSWVGENALLLVAKDKHWAMPAKYVQAKGPIGEFLRNHPLPDNSTSNALDWMGHASKYSVSQSGALMQQIPHDWFLPLPFRDDAIGQHVNGVSINKDTSPTGNAKARLFGNPKERHAARLIGPSSFTTRLSQSLVGKTELKEWMLILDWQFHSRLAVTNGQLVIEADIVDCKPRVAVPVEDKSTADGKVELVDYMVAIDLGETQIGYAVFDVKEALLANQRGAMPQPIIDPLTGEPANGALWIPSIRALIRAAKNHRGKQANNTKIKQNYSKTLEQMREAVIGDVCQRIEALCARFDAFPLLESSVENFQSGSRQLDLVYGSVVRRYTYTSVDAHTSTRTAHWMGGDKWAHPYLQKRDFDETKKKRGNSSKPLKLFPGNWVYPIGTSQTCIHCGRNAIKELKDMRQSDRLAATDGGLIETPSGTMRLMQQSISNYSQEERRQAKRQKLNLAMNKPIEAKQYPVAEIVKMVRHNMRQREFNERGHGTTQGRFQCVYADCGKTYHADAGAAINIGRKFFADGVIDIEKSCAQLKEHQNKS